MSKKLYTTKEDDYIFAVVKDSEETLSKCFIALAEELDRSPQAIAQRWYKYLSNPESPYYRGTASLYIKRKKVGINRTNFKYSIEVRESWWTRVLRFLKLK